MRKYQSGFIAWNWALLMVAGCLAVICAVKMVPAYMEHIYVNDALKFLVQNNSNVASLEKSQIKEKLDKYMITNAVKDPQASSFVYKRMHEGLIVSSIYEVRAPILFNVDVVMSFKSQLNTSKPDQCCDYLVDVEKKSSDEY